MADMRAGAGASLPKTLKEVTADWFAQALSLAYPGVALTGFRPGAVIKGMATKAQYFLEYNDAGRDYGLPPSLWIKAGFEKGSERSIPLYAAEVNFFRDLAGKLPVRTPKCFFQAIDPDDGNGVLILEDLTLRHARFGKQSDPLTPDGAAKVLAAQAGYHAYLRSADHHADYPWLTVGGAIGQVDVTDEFLGFWDHAETLPRYRFVPQALKDRDRVRRGIRAMEALDRRCADSLVHGDCHLGNLFFEPGGGIGLIDWQTCMRGHWAFDVSYFMTVSLSVEDRRRTERDLIAHYLAEVARHGAPPLSFEDAWLAYRQHVAWCFLTIMCPVEKQTEDICMLNSERTSAAMTDLDTLGALGV